ncbi:MAG: hypothetical protein ACYC5X_17995 [Syntrophales bacterium]
MATYTPNRLDSVRPAELQPDPTQPWKYLDPLAFEELTTSISQIGIIKPQPAYREKPVTSIEISKA